jgi:hypothetical protein
MPRYEFQCPTCGCITTVTRTIAERNEPLFCDGGGTLDDPDERFEDATHETIEMERVASNLAAVRVINKRYA